MTFVTFTFSAFANFKEKAKTQDLMMKDMVVPFDLPDELYSDIKQLRNFDMKLPITFYEMCVFEETKFLFYPYIVNHAEEVKVVKEESLDLIFKAIGLPLRDKEKEFSKAGDDTYNPDFAMKMSLKLYSQLIQTNKLKFK